MTTIICYDTDVKVEKKPVVLSIKERVIFKRHPIRIIVRTNGESTETIVINKNNITTRRYINPCTEEDRYDYEQDVKVENKRNDKLMKDANNAFNLLLTKGYLYRRKGITGWVRSINEASAKIVVNTSYDSKVICALLKLYFPNRKWEVTQ